MAGELGRTAPSRIRLQGINGLRKACAVGAYIIRAGAWLQRVWANAYPVYVQCENRFAEGPVALRTILRDSHGVSAGERSAHVASVAALDIGIGVAARAPLVCRPGADGETYECSHYERAYDLLHFRFLLSRSSQVGGHPPTIRRHGAGSRHITSRKKSM